MHIPDGFVSGPINLATAVVSGAAVSLSTWRASAQARLRPSNVPLLATTAAFIFAAQMLNFPIAAGTSGHFLGAAVVAALLGPASACLVLALVLVIQCFLFTDGGSSALGSNVFNMGLVAGLSSFLIMRLLRPFLPRGRSGFLLAVGVAAWASIVLAAAACSLELALSGTFPFLAVFPAMVGTHALIGIGEALISVAVLSAVWAARPDLLPAWTGASPDFAPPRRATPWIFASLGLAIALFLAFVVSPYASSAPDGLEKVTSGISSSVPQPASSWSLYIFPDYSVPGVHSERLSTGLAGLIGTLAVFVLGFILIRLFSARSRPPEA